MKNIFWQLRRLYYVYVCGKRTAYDVPVTLTISVNTTSAEEAREQVDELLPGIRCRLKPYLDAYPSTLSMGKARLNW